MYIKLNLISHSRWLTGGCGLHTGGKYTVFHRFCAFYHCLVYIIIDGYSNAMRLGWVFSRFFNHEQGSCCTVNSCGGISSRDTYL